MQGNHLQHKRKTFCSSVLVSVLKTKIKTFFVLFLMLSNCFDEDIDQEDDRWFPDQRPQKQNVSPTRL